MATRFPVSSIAGDLISLRSAMDRLFNESYVQGQGGSMQRAMPLDVYATENEIVVLAAIPGINPEDVDITIEKNVLTISGSMANVAESEEARDATWYLHELPYGSFERTLTLPMELDSNRAEATIDNGMLRLVLPKAETARPRQIKVSVGGGKQEAVDVETAG